MDSNEGGNSPYQQRSRQSAAEAARQKVLAVYSSATQSLQNHPEQLDDDYPEDSYYQNQESETTGDVQNYHQDYSQTSYQNQQYYPEYSTDSTYDTSPYDHTDYRSSSYATNSTSSYTNTDSNYNYSNQNYPPTSTYSGNSNYQSEDNAGSFGQDHLAEFSETYIPDDSIPWAADSTIYTQDHTTHSNYNQTQPNQTKDISDTYAQSDSASNNYSELKHNETSFNDLAISQDAIDKEWKQYHSAWQDYYRQYYENYYSNAAQTYIQTEKLKDQRIASGKQRRKRHTKRLIPIFILIGLVISVLFLQYNRLIFAPIMAYISPDTDSVASSIEAVDPNITQAVSADPRLIIPKLNIDVPVAFGINYNDVMEAMNHGVAQFMIPGASAMPGQIGNLVISGHSAGDIYSSNPYKFIFSGLERLQEGDLIYVNYESVRYTYQMTRREVVEPDNVQALVYATDKPMLTLITCTPLGTSRYRLLITAEQISPSYNGDQTEPEIPSTPDQDYSMPSNSPSLFENVWNGLFGS